MASTSQSPTAVSSTDPANQSSSQTSFDFESFMTYLQSFVPAADAMITVNFGTGTPQEAAAWVHYANVVKKYGIRYWQVGNELPLQQMETGGPLDAQDYVKRYLEFYDAMKAEDPSIVVLGRGSRGISQPSNLGDGKTFIQDFILFFLAVAGKADHIDGIDFHRYPSYGPVSDLRPTWRRRRSSAFSPPTSRPWLAATAPKPMSRFFSPSTTWARAPSRLRSTTTSWSAVCGLPPRSASTRASLLPQGSGTFLWLVLSGGSTGDATDATAGDMGYLQSTNNTYRYQEHANAMAMQMMSSLWAMAGETRPHQLVATTSSQSSLAAYAAVRPDGALTLAVINQDEANAYSASINLAPFVPATAADVWTFDAHNYAWETTTAPYHAEPDTGPTHALVCGAA